MSDYQVTCGRCDRILTVAFPDKPAARRVLWNHAISEHWDELIKEFPPGGYTLKKV